MAAACPILIRRLSMMQPKFFAGIDWDATSLWSGAVDAKGENPGPQS